MAAGGSDVCFGCLFACVCVCMYVCVCVWSTRVSSVFSFLDVIWTAVHIFFYPRPP